MEIYIKISVIFAKKISCFKLEDVEKGVAKMPFGFSIGYAHVNQAMRRDKRNVKENVLKIKFFQMVNASAKRGFKGKMEDVNLSAQKKRNLMKKR